MRNVIFEGRESVEITHTSIEGYIYKLLEENDLTDYIIAKQLLDDDVIINASTDDLYEYYINKYNIILNNILIKYGILVKEYLYLTDYNDIFMFLYNMKYIDFNSEMVSLIINGDYNKEDKLFLLFDLIVDEPTTLIEKVETSDLLFIKIADLLENSKSLENSSNTDMLLRAFAINKSSSNFKETVLFKDIITGYSNIMLSLLKDKELIIKEIKERLKPFVDIYSANKLLEVVLIETVYSFIFYNDNDIIDLKKEIDVPLIENIMDTNSLDNNSVLIIIENILKDFNKE